MTEVKFKEDKFVLKLQLRLPRILLRGVAAAALCAISLSPFWSPVLISSAHASDRAAEAALTPTQFTEYFRIAAEARSSHREVSMELTPVSNEGEISQGQISEWTLPFSFADLPEGTRPDRFEFSIVSGATHDMAGQMLHVFLNDQVLRSLRPSTGRSTSGAQSYSIALPYSLLSLENDLRVLVQSQACAGSCEEGQGGTSVLTMLAGHLQLATSTSRPKEFFELAPYFRSGVDVAVRASAMADPDQVVNALLAMGPSVLPADAEINFHFVPDGMRFAPRGPFVLYGVEPSSQDRAALRLDRGEVSIRSSDGETILSLADHPDAAVVQMLDVNGHVGLWVNEAFPVAAEPSDLGFNRGNLAVVDGQGIALWLNADAPRGPLVDYVDQHHIADFLAANRLIVLITVWSLLTLLMLRVFVSGRRKTKAEAKGSRN